MSPESDDMDEDDMRPEYDLRGGGRQNDAIRQNHTTKPYDKIVSRHFDNVPFCPR